MRIGLVSDTLATRAGSEHSVVMTATRLAGRGHDVHLFAYCRDGPVHPVWRDRLQAAGVEMLAFPEAGASLAEIGRRLLALAPDIIHAIPMESLDRRFVPIARTVSGAAILGTMTSDPGPNNFWYDDLDPANLAGYDLILSPSAMLARRLKRMRGRQIRTAFVPHIIPAPDPPVASGHWQMTPAQWAKRDRIGAITRLREEKGPDFLLSAFAMIAARRPGSHLTLYGELTELERSRNVAMALGIADRIAWHGPFDGPAEIDAIVRDHCLFLLPSLFESMPISLMEVLARGRLCVASDVGAVRELFERVPGGGRAVPVGDPRAMADAALEWLTGNRAPAGRHATAAFQEHFSPDRAVARLEAAYRRALGRRRSD